MADETRQISATVKEQTVQTITRLAQESNRSFSQMVDILLSEILSAKYGQKKNGTDEAE